MGFVILHKEKIGCSKRKSVSFFYGVRGALALLSLLALLYYTFFYKPDMLLGKANDLDRAFSNIGKAA